MRFCLLLLQPGGDDVVQEPEILWEPKSGSASLSCKHNMGSTYYQMYWYRQRPGETMRLIVFMTVSELDFGDVDKKKFETQKSDAESGSLKVKALEPDDSAIYFCAVSEHSVSKTGECCTKTFCAEKDNNSISQQVAVWYNQCASCENKKQFSCRRIHIQTSLKYSSEIRWIKVLFNLHIAVWYIQYAAFQNI
uniref:Ig-like domain-containing protein n=1 Tax=Cyprinus carpio TaxID=7962 RepID=A0A8C1SYJ7_CYPCA